MRRFHLAVALLGAVVVFSAVDSASGQSIRPRPRYRPATPTLSPYMDLLRFNDGMLPNYHTFVRPKQEYRRTVQRQDIAIRNQAARIGALGQQVNRIEYHPAIRPTGAAGGYMNYSHYYQMRSPLRGR